MDTTITQTIDTLSQTINTLNQTISTNSGYDWGVLIIQGLILGVLIVSALFIKKQLKTQNKMLNAQLLKDRIILGWQTDEPITKEHIGNLAYLPRNFMPDNCIKLFNEINDTNNEGKKEENKNKIGKYLYLSKVYGYFRWIFIMSEEMEIEEHLDDKWPRKWIRNICQDDVFLDIRKFNKREFPDFEKEIVKQIKTIEKEDFEEVECDLDELWRKLVENKYIDKDKKATETTELNNNLANLNEDQIIQVKSILEQQCKYQK